MKEMKKTRFAGIGISLELIQEIVRNLNGKIWADQIEENKDCLSYIRFLSKIPEPDYYAKFTSNTNGFTH